MQATFWSRHRGLKWVALSCAVLLIAVTVAAVIAARHAEPVLRALIVEKLQQHFQARVELDSFHVSIAQGLRAEGKGLRIWPTAQVAATAVGSNAGKPLIEIAEFRFRVPLHYVSGKPVRVSRIELKGLTINIPPDAHLMHMHGSPSAAGPLPASAAEADAAPPATSGQEAPAGQQATGSSGANSLPFQIDMVVCDGATLILQNKDPAKQPLIFQILKIKATHIGSNSAIHFEATLTNPRPKGLVVTQGSFGPWEVDAPAMTPIRGNYTFDHADLGTFKGISGTLNSTGRYQGPLAEMTVDGVTDTPNFALTSFGTPMPLHTVFHATVDGTNGDTWLQPVNATLGHTQFVARGKVVELRNGPATPGKPTPPAGHEIALTVNVDHGQIGDFLRLTSHHGNALLNGTLHMQAALEIPPGSNPVHERLRLKGSFILDDVQFTDPKIQDRLGDLSMRGQGKPKEAKSSAAADVRSTMTSDFTVANAVIDLPNLSYSLPGAVIDVKGNYDIDGGGLDFSGNARMEATVSKMVGGWKGALLSPLDRFFKKDGAGTRVKLRIEGTRQDPQFAFAF